METYSEARLPHRKVFTTLNDAIDDINPWAKFSNVSMSVWWYKEIEQKYEGVGEMRHPTRIGPKYSTAITNKMFFDIDCMDSEGRYLKEVRDGMIKLWDWAVLHNYRRDVSFTGGGYQMCIGANIRPEFYWETVDHVRNTLDIIIDPVISLVGMRRIIGTYNWGSEGHVNKNGLRVGYKSSRNAFCISLKENEVHLPWHKHLILASKQKKEIYKYGVNMFEPPKLKVRRKKRNLDHRTDFNLHSSVDEILDKYGYTYDDMCQCIRDIIEKPHVNHVERMMVIKYLKTIMCMEYADTVMLLPKLLTAPHGNSNDGSHSILEGQPMNIYSSGLVFRPDRMKLEGYCYPDCNECGDFIKAMKRL